MVGSDESAQKLGLIPSAISWLYSAIERRREKTWTDLSVSVSALELCCGEEDTLRDLLGEVVPSGGGGQDSPTAHIRLQEDPVGGIQLRNHNRVRAPTAERAASLLDAAITARRHTDFVTYLSHSSIMFFTLHVQPPRTESNTIGKGSRGPTKLTMIDVCRGMRFNSKNKYPYSELGSVVLSLLNGQKTIPNKSSKLTLLLRETLGHVNCHTAVVAQVSDSLAVLDETLATLQMASKIRRTQKKEKPSTSCSPHARSLTREKKGPTCLSLRAFHSTEEVDSDMRPFRLRSRFDDHSGSEQSCDAVIRIDSDGLVQARAAPRLTQPEFVPIIPSLYPNKAHVDDPEFTALLKELLKIPQLHGDKRKEESIIEALKCDTFAELQERLGCIDGSEATMDMLKSTLNAAKSEPVKKTCNLDNEASDAAQTLLNQGRGEMSGGETQTDGAFPGDSFQREDSGLYDCEECSAASSGEELLNQTLGRNATCRPETHNRSSKKHHLDPQGINNTPQPTGKQESRGASDWLKPDKRASPVGKSFPISPSTSCSNSESLATSVILGDVLPNLPSTERKEMKATITVTVKQPLDLKGQDELVYSMVEEVTISGGMNSVRTAGNIICFRDATQSPTDQSTGSSAPIRIISNVSDDSVTTDGTSTISGATQKTHFRPEKGSLPSFINPMLMNTDMDCDLEFATNEKSLESEIRRKDVKCQEKSKTSEAKNSTCERHVEKSKQCDSHLQNACGAVEESSNTTCRKRPKSTDRSHNKDKEDVCATSSPKGAELVCKGDGNTPKRTGVSPGNHKTAPVAFKSGSLPRAWQDTKSSSNDSRAANRKNPREVTSSTPGSPCVTLERRQGGHYSHANQSISAHVVTLNKQDSSCTAKSGVPSLFENVKQDIMNVRSKSPFEDSSRLFSVKLEQLVCRTNSLERTPRDFPILERGSSSNTSISSKSSSDGASKSYRVYSEGDYTLPRSSRSPKKNPRLDQDHQFSPSEYTKQFKLSAVGKLKMSSPKVRRQSAPSIKNVSHKSLRQSINRSASLSPDSKTVSFERMSSFLSTSPPHQSISRTPSQSSTCSSTKSAIQGFVNGKISDLLKERAGSPSSLDALPSPYTQITAPRLPSPNGYASDTTSVLSGDLPPAMRKTSLHFSNRNSTVSSGYGSMLRDSEARASGTSHRDSVSDRSGSLLSAGRSSRRRGGTGVHQRCPPHESSHSLKRSTSGLRSRFVERGIPEAYEIKVYEIDNMQQTQKRAGASVFQCQADVFGASSAEDLRGAVQIARAEDRAGGGQRQPHPRAHQVEPRL